jgi:hypothetical protein
MKTFLSLIILIFTAFNAKAEVIMCGDVMSVGEEARLTLHKSAQKRAQIVIEDFMEKKITTPYAGWLVKPENATPSTMAYLIEAYWCETDETPLHSAYYRYYSSNKSAFE